jgi:hypothetical protein
MCLDRRNGFSPSVPCLLLSRPSISAVSALKKLFKLCRIMSNTAETVECATCRDTFPRKTDIGPCGKCKRLLDALNKGVPRDQVTKIAVS